MKIKKKTIIYIKKWNRDHDTLKKTKKWIQKKVKLSVYFTKCETRENTRLWGRERKKLLNGNFEIFNF